MVATRGRTFKRPWRGSCHSSKLKSSSAPIGRKDSWCFHGVGSSNAPLLGSTAAEGLQRIGRTSIATRWRFCGLPQSASCSENFVIPPDVFGQTLRKVSTTSLLLRRRVLRGRKTHVFRQRLRLPSPLPPVGDGGLHRTQIQKEIRDHFFFLFVSTHLAALVPLGRARKIAGARGVDLDRRAAS